jgi:TonB family protein
LAERIETPAPPTPNATASKEPPPPTAAPAPTAVANARGGLPGPSAEAADPAPDTARESDPFSKIPAVEFRDGKVAARDGRQIKPVRPRLSEIAQRDLLGLQFPTILAKVRIDKTGKVTDVTLLRGSGSEAIDQPVYRALWNWWFEPPKDKKGNPLDDTQLVAIHWS